MKYTEARQGRIFVLRLEDGEILHETVEAFAREKSIPAAMVMAVGGADEGSRLVAGPEKGRAKPVRPVEIALGGVHELAGVGTVFPDAGGAPVLHMHAACGRGADARAGCVRAGVRTWHVMEVVLIELRDASAERLVDPETGFELLQPYFRVDKGNLKRS